MEELERAAKIVNQLRDLSRPTNMKDKQPVDLNALIDKVLLLTRKIRHAGQIELIWNPTEGLPLVPLVAEGIQQVCINLVLNAVAAMPDGGQLQIKTCQTNAPDGIQLTIKDTGTGIESTQMERIFEPFYSTRPEGLGLGLFISKKIIEQHDGQIEVESSPANGTTFHIWLPT
jgi:signal transduction histidine kinase